MLIREIQHWLIFYGRSEIREILLRYNISTEGGCMAARRGLATHFRPSTIKQIHTIVNLRHRYNLKPQSPDNYNTYRKARMWIAKLSQGPLI